MTQPTMAALQLFKTTPRNHHHHQNVASRRDSSQPFYTLTEPSATWHGDPAAPSPPGRPQDSPAGNQTAGLSAGTIVAIVFSGLVLTFLLTGAYTCASARHKSGRDRRSTVLGRRVHFYNDDDIEMQAKRHTRGSLLDQRGGDRSTDKGDYQQVPYHGEGAGMGYDDDEDGTEARIEVGTARVARIRRVPAGSVSIRNIGRGGAAPVPMGSSQSVRDVVSLPDLAWAETLTTGGGRRPAVICAPAAGPLPPPPPLPPATTTTRASSKSSGSERSRKLQERSESRRAVKRKAIREWCARGSGGGIGPYSAAY